MERHGTGTSFHQDARARLIVISNRVPVRTDTAAAGGLAVALSDALADSRGVWFGWSGTLACERQHSPNVLERDGTTFVTLPLTEEDYRDYYAGYANSVLWPALHGLLHAVQHRPGYAEAYRDVNAHFADHAASCIRPGDVVWVHDYHFIPLGEELRRRRVGARIGFFLHVPFPPLDLLRALPGHRQLLEALAAYDLVGFQTESDAQNFAAAARSSLGAKVDAAGGIGDMPGRRFRFGAFPIGIDAAETAATARVQRAAAPGRRMVRELRGRKLVIGADRLDYTKGLAQRLAAFEHLLAKHYEELDDRMIYVQISAPSREQVAEYRDMARRLESDTGRINGHYGHIDWTPLRLIEQAVPRDVLLGYLSLADVALVTSLRDGMNLVAKEFLAAQPPEDPGVLVLSSLAGAASELGDAAIVVNPYDTSRVAEGVYEALRMPLEERRQRWRIGFSSLCSNSARVWRERFLARLTAPPVRSGRDGEAVRTISARPAQAATL